MREKIDDYVVQSSWLTNAGNPGSKVNYQRHTLKALLKMIRPKVFSREAMGSP